MMGFTLFERTTINYPDGMDEDLVKFFDSEYLATIENVTLKTDLEEKFFFLFDEVNEIRVQYSDANGYYYLLFVEKKGESKLELLKIEETDYRNETYSYIDFTNLEVDEFTQFCRQGILPQYPGVCPVACENYPTGCFGMSCGIVVNGECVQQ